MGTTSVGQPTIEASSAAEHQGERGERRAESESGGGQEEVLDGGEHRRLEHAPVPEAGVPAHHDEDRGAGDAPLRARLDIGEERPGTADPRSAPGPRPPRPGG